MDNPDTESLNCLEVILKTVERCNLNCSYCYFFNGNDQSFKKHPPFIKKETINEISSFLIDACKAFPLKKIRIDFHGGEPTLQKLTDFDDMCFHFQNTLSSYVKVEFAIQTNATLINEDWIKLFSRYNVSVGVSLDGPKDYHDEARLDHKGKGSYDKVKEGLLLLNESWKKQRIRSLGVLCVINPKRNAEKIYRHFIDDLGITNMDFLFPDYTHNNFIHQSAEDYGEFLCNLFDAWTRDDNANITIRVLASTLRTMLGGTSLILGHGANISGAQAITISSNGDLSPDDSLRSAIPHLMQAAHIKTTTLKEFLGFPIFSALTTSKLNLPKACQQCCWEKPCGGGKQVNRYSNENSFNNSSVLCKGLKQFYTKVAKYLLLNGVPSGNLSQILCEGTI